jgi:hypothetical protein
MNVLGALEARYADEHVPLALVLGAVAVLSAMRRLLPDRPAGRAPEASFSPDPGGGCASEPFLALLLGVISIHERVLELCGPALARPHGDEPTGDDRYRQALEGLLRRPLLR